MHRRHFLQAGGTLAAAGVIWALVKTQRSTGVVTTNNALLDVLCDLVIPDTDTPGARAAGVPQFIEFALQKGMLETAPDNREQLERELDALTGKPFLQLTAQEQLSALTKLDDAQFGPDTREHKPPASMWPRFKKLIVMGYYTSEIGASQELHYQLVPGRFDPDLPFKEGDRASANDWVGQRFP